ncbi:MAG: hypothetical protein GYB67_12780 [Chloroflexi bacterium]|nr:hypothetical protein [Chloroflexota bacterium]
MMPRKRRLMHEVLDETLPEARLRKLRAEMSEQPEAAAAYNRLRRTDQMLRAAPFEHAPQGLAMKIMTRLATELDPKRFMRSSGLALALGLALITLLCVPVLAVIAWLLISLIGSAGALSGLTQEVVALMSRVLGGLDGLAEGAQDLLAAYPEVPLLMLTLIPLGGLWLAGFAWRNRAPKQPAPSEP